MKNYNSNNNFYNDNIITINGTADNMFDKAIFVLKPELTEDPNSLDFVKEADKILNNFMVQAVYEMQKTAPDPRIQAVTTTTKVKRRRRTKQDEMIDRILAFSVMFCGIIVMYLLFV